MFESIILNAFKLTRDIIPTVEPRNVCSTISVAQYQVSRSSYSAAQLFLSALNQIYNFDF
jgi:hypothetical protein